jgi:hypothetical protein
LRNPVKGIHDLRMVLRRESARAAIAVKFNNEHALGISRHLHGAICIEVLSLTGLHSILLLVLLVLTFQLDRSFEPNRCSQTPPRTLNLLVTDIDNLVSSYFLKIAVLFAKLQRLRA